MIKCGHRAPQAKSGLINIFSTGLPEPPESDDADLGISALGAGLPTPPTRRPKVSRFAMLN
jgi:hypothetical protein